MLLCMLNDLTSPKVVFEGSHGTPAENPCFQGCMYDVDVDRSYMTCHSFRCFPFRLVLGFKLDIQVEIKGSLATDAQQHDY